MTKKVYYIENTNENYAIIENIVEVYICFVQLTTVEMNCLEVTIICRNEDVKAIEEELKDIV